jgi:16S rRNA (cytosine967-C5)-methyltransferase
VLEQSFPDSIVQEWVRRYGVEETELLCRASNSPAPTTVRANTLKCSREECRQALHSEDVASELTRLSPFGLILEKRVNTRTLKTFRNGWFELQDEGSQLLALLTGAGPGSFVVDACAGGGGKTLHLASLMENRGKILAFDIDQRRLSRLDERCHRAGVTIVDAILSPPGGAGVAAVGATADAVLIDAPCSGTGTFRRNPGAKLTYDENTVVSMTKSQRQLLEVFSGLVRPGGRLVYATCSLLHAENEAAVEQFLAGAPGFSLLSARDVLSAWGVILPDPSPYLHLHPHRTATDGFFAAVMVRNVG